MQQCVGHKTRVWRRMEEDGRSKERREGERMGWRGGREGGGILAIERAGQT